MKPDAPLRIVLLLVAIPVLSLCGSVVAQDNPPFLSVTGPCRLEFPRDHGPHPDYRTEWWYTTGNVRAESGEPFGFQLTFFRSRVSPLGAENRWPDPPSAWRTRQVYIGHAAVSDMANRRHLHSEIVSRQALGLAGAEQIGPETTVFVNTWKLLMTPDRHRLQADSDDFSFSLDATPTKPPVLHGNRGYSRKGASPERASCYYSFTRLATRGSLAMGERSFRVEGLCWMDHEFSTAPLEPGITGWDWFSLQLSDGTDIMIYLLRQKDGTLSPASSGTFVDGSGAPRHLDPADFRVTVSGRWKSPRSGAVYPSGWTLVIVPFSLRLEIIPNLSDQEMQTPLSTGVTYWEGSVAINGKSGPRTVRGSGYVELTGYATPLDAPM